MNTNTVSGNIASFYTPRQVDLSSLKVHFSPKQLGEGDPSPSNVREIVPYTGVIGYHMHGQGVRLMPVNFQEQTIDGVTLKYLGDGKYFFEGTAISSAVVFDVNIKPMVFSENWNYFKYNTYLKETTPWNFTIGFRNSDNKNVLLDPVGFIYNDGFGDEGFYINSNVIDYLNEIIGETITKIRFVITPNLSNLIVTPEICSLTDNSITTIPMNFNCPTGKNLLNMDSTWTITGSNNGTYSHSGNENYGVIKNGNLSGGYIVHLKNNQTVTFSFNLNYTPINAFIRQRIFVLSNGASSRVANTIIDSNRAVTTYTSDQEADYIFGIYCQDYENEAPNGELVISNWQVENGSTATTYEKYTSAVYGGYVDLVTGELVMEYKLLHFIKNYISGVIESGFQNASQYYALTATIGNAASFQYKRELAICDKMKTIQSDLAKPELQPAEGLLIGERRWMFGLPSGITTLEGARNWMEEIGGFDLCYPIAEPIHYQLTPQQITSLLETNTIWSNADSVEVTYPVIPTCNLEKSRHNILMGYPHKETVETANGTIVNFSTDMVAPMEKLQIGFKPIQQGEGDPSPENVMEIEGTSSMVINTAGKNLAHVVGYSATAGINIYNLTESNRYGTTISTILPERSVVITQTQYPITTSISDYRNGYVCFTSDSLQFEHRYNVSFKASNIISNPLNATLYGLILINPAGNAYYPTEIIEDRVIYKNIRFIQSKFSPCWYGFDIRICGMSFTLSDIMITEAIETDMSFEPYDGNVINVAFPLSGKNYWNPEYISASATTYTTTNTGITVTSSSAGTFRYVTFKTSNITPDDIGKTFTFSTNAVITSGQARILVSIRNPNGSNFATLLKRASDTDQILTGSFTIPSGFPDNGWFQCAFYCTGSAGGSGEVEYSNIQLELGSSATTYEEYIPLYGGYVDLVNGELWAEWGRYVVNENSNIREFSGTYRIVNALSDHLPLESALSQSICNQGGYSAYASQTLPKFSLTAGGTIYFRQTFTTLFPTVEDFINHVRENNIEIVYPLATPVRYQLTPTQIKTLKGINNIWSTANGDITATYYTHGENAYQHIPTSDAIVSDDDYLITTDDGYVIGTEDDFIVY